MEFSIILVSILGVDEMKKSDHKLGCKSFVVELA